MKFSRHLSDRGYRYDVRFFSLFFEDHSTIGRLKVVMSVVISYLVGV
jgi:hypothetical protein